MSNIKNVTVLGSGVLGGQIAWHTAFKGKNVVVYDIAADALERCKGAHAQYEEVYKKDVGANEADIAATRSRLRYSTDLADAVQHADLVIEAVPEVPAIKSEIYQKMAQLLQPHALIATNSSTLLARDFANATGRPDKFCALHYANLIWIMNVIEIMAHSKTAKETLHQVTQFTIETGMLPIAVQKEQNGYVLNTWFVPLITAAQTLVTNGISTPEDVDRTYLKVNAGAGMGPMALIDMVGMKTFFDVLTYWGHERGDQQMLDNAAYLKARFLDKGLMGMQTGEGYYKYPNPAYQQPDFLAVPDMSGVDDIVARVYQG
ncbi:3-hydroxyacyl-CoA dehydrogenase [Burkholderia cepacia]|uniref:3-hydroxyacyl-CoA dehydrogenase n=1 Tax=Burkholderia cepacia TaxID=292 RepID=UPI002AB6569D|nr:3-hydroxyacyl-CoA dehydrogenase [Burkholderia cepacia]